MSRIPMLVSGLLLCSTVPAIAAQTNSAPVKAPASAEQTPDPARIAAAEKYFAAMDYDVQIDRVMNSMLSAFDKMLDDDFSKSTKEIPPDFAAKLQVTMKGRMHDIVLGHRAELKHGQIEIYARHFTVPELEHLAAMQTDPIIVKMRAEMPQIAGETITLAQSLMTGEIPKLQQELRAEIAEYVRTHTKKPRS